MSGWIKIHRKVTEWEWYTDIPCKVLFMHLIIVANRKPSKWRGMTIGIGQRLTGRKILAEETGLSEQEVRTALYKLKSTSDITIKSTNKFSIITVCNYKNYQCCEIEEQPASQPASQPTINQQSTTNKKEKNKEEKRLVQSDALNGFEEFWKAYPRKEKKKEAMAAWKKGKCGNGIFETVMGKLEQFKATDQWSRDGGRFIPLPSSWINGERWNDEVQGQRTTGEKIGGLTF